MLRANFHQDTMEVFEVVARVKSSRLGGLTYVVDYLDETWTCTCRDSGAGCAHIAAVQLVTGHATAELRATA